jgi:prephenate dehydrogenase
MRVAIIGLGQIGGSVGRALIAAGEPWQVIGWTRSDEARRTAAEDGLEMAPSIGDACRDADLIVLAAPALVCLELLDALGDPLRASLAPDAVITDVASTKAQVTARAVAHGLRFVGGHPMAGRESRGYASSDPALFVGRPWVVTPAEPADAAAEERVTALATACGAEVVRLDPKVHDAAVAAISHLPLVMAAALVEAVAGGPDWPLERRLAAGGWASMTRLARGDAEMGTGILATNAEAIAARVRDLRDVLDGWLADLESTPADADRLRHRLASARQALEEDEPATAEPAIVE